MYKHHYTIELQVRTIFEEAWSEIDHKIRYPYFMHDKLFSEYLLILNRLAGSADEMGTYIKFLQVEQQENEKILAQFEEKINSTNIEPAELKLIKENIQKFRNPDELSDEQRKNILNKFLLNFAKDSFKSNNE